MITYTALGKNGRLGNQMFQYATLFSVCFLRGQTPGIPREGHQLFDTFKLENADTLLDNQKFDYKYDEPDFSFSPNVFLAPDGTDLHGYFQSPHYFRHCAKALRKEFIFHDEIVEKARHQMQVFENEHVCSLHVRRGDYLNLSDYHTNLSSDYYQNAVNTIIGNFQDAKFLIFSDDIEWCKKTFVDNRISYAEIGDDAVEMCMMSMCNSHIIANSSFSWWGAWLSASNAVIAPKQWFSKKGPKDWSSIYEQGWAII